MNEIKIFFFGLFKLNIIFKLLLLYNFVFTINNIQIKLMLLIIDLISVETFFNGIRAEGLNNTIFSIKFFILIN